VKNHQYTDFHVGLIILAAGGSIRYHSAKALANWHGKTMIRHITDEAIKSNLGPVIVVTGKYLREIDVTLTGSGAIISNNPDWEKGLSSSIHVGIRNLPEVCTSAIFLLGDQPFVTVGVLKKLAEKFYESHASIVAPLVNGKVTNPILFSRIHFSELLATTGDIGGKELLKIYPVEGVVWEDEMLRIDIDTPDDYARWADKA
jgi:CTP:molybdopterin cytidylyltransferase MocA